MQEDTAVSGPVTGDAGAKPDGLDAAFDKAFDSVEHNDNDFAAPAKPVAKAPEKPAKAPKVKTADNSTVTEDAAPAVPGDEGEAQEGETETVASPAVSPPAHWDAAKREAFGKLADPEAQKIVLDLAKDLEAGFTKKTQELSEDRKFAQGIRSLITDGHREQLRRAGMDEVGGIRHLMSLQDYATRDPAGYIRWAMQEMRLDPRQVFPQLTGDGMPQQELLPEQYNRQPDPSQQQYEALQQLTDAVRGLYQERQDTQNRGAERAITGFKSATNESGQPLYPHFDAVEQDMIWILQSDPAIKAVDDLGERLKRAYDLAVYRNPDLRNQIIDTEAQNRASAAARQAELAKAKRAKAPVQASPPVTSTAGPKNLADAVNRAMSQMGAS